MVLWGRSVFGRQKVLGRFHQGSAKVPPSFQQGFTEVPPRFHQGSANVLARLRKFRYLSGLLGQIRLGPPKGSVEGSPITSLHLSPSSSALVLHFSPTASALGPLAIVTVLGQN